MATIDTSNYVDLQQSTGERFASMADRLEDPARLQYLGDVAQAGDRALAKALRGLVDDEEAVARFAPPAAEPPKAGRK